jgi:hypothetical protein
LASSCACSPRSGRRHRRLGGDALTGQHSRRCPAPRGLFAARAGAGSWPGQGASWAPFADRSAQFERRGHWVQIERAAEFIPLLTDFLSAAEDGERVSEARAELRRNHLPQGHGRMWRKARKLSELKRASTPRVRSCSCASRSPASTGEAIPGPLPVGRIRGGMLHPASTPSNRREPRSRPAARKPPLPALPARPRRGPSEGQRDLGRRQFEDRWKITNSPAPLTTA